MAFHLYQSKKVKRYIGDSVYNDLPWDETQIDPLTIWFVDVFFVNRQKYLVIANPLTKLTFLVFRYTRKTHPDLMGCFRERLAIVLNAARIDPTLYLEQCDWLVPFEKSNRSASAHLSQTKSYFELIIKENCHGMHGKPDDEQFYNTLLADNLVQFKGNNYDRPSQRFYHELLLRRWV